MRNLLADLLATDRRLLSIFCGRRANGNAAKSRLLSAAFKLAVTGSEYAMRAHWLSEGAEATSWFFIRRNCAVLKLENANLKLQRRPE